MHKNVVFGVLSLCVAPLALAATPSADGNSAHFEKIFPHQYHSYIASMASSEEPDRINAPVDPI